MFSAQSNADKPVKVDTVFFNIGSSPAGTDPMNHRELAQKNPRSLCDATVFYTATSNLIGERDYNCVQRICRKLLQVQSSQWASPI
jgi:hypothetical protein